MLRAKHGREYECTHIYSYSSLLYGVASVSFLTYWYEERRVPTDLPVGMYSTGLMRTEC